MSRIIGAISALTFFWSIHVFAQPSAEPVASLSINLAFKFIVAKQWTRAIEEFNKIYWNDAKNSNDALFYIIYCQDRIGSLEQAKSNLKYLNVQSLPENKQAIIKKIRSKEIEREEPSLSVFNVTSNYGGLGFGSSSLYTSGTLYGFVGSWASLSQKISFGYDHLDLRRVSADPFLQNQFTLSYGRSLGDYLGTKLMYIKLLNNDSTTNNASIYSASLSAGSIASGLSFAGTFYLSGYSNYVPGGLSVYQGELSGNIRLGFDSLSSSFMYLKGVGIWPTLAPIYASSIFNQGYYSGELGFRFQFVKTSAGFSGWYGRQLFSIQNDGASIWNVAYERNWGAKGNFAINLSQIFQVGFFGGVESIKESSTIQSSSFVNGGFLSLSF
jgi:hypothetical protein